MPDDTRAALAAIGGEAFADAMAVQVWPLAVVLLEAFSAQPSAEQRRAWLEHAAENFRRIEKAPVEMHEALKAEAVRYMASMPDELRLLRRWPSVNAEPEEWVKAIELAAHHPGVLRSARKGPTNEAAEVARAMLPVFSAVGMKVTLYERGPAVAALRCIGNAASAEAGLQPCTAWRWRMALKEALTAA